MLRQHVSPVSVVRHPKSSVIAFRSVTSVQREYLVILQPDSDASPFCDGTPTIRTSEIVDDQIPEADGHQSDLAIADSVQHGVTTAGSDASHSSREHTDASSVDSLDITSAEKPKYKKKRIGHQSLKDTMFAIYHKRKSTPCTVASADKSPDSPRRSSAPQTHTSTSKPHLPVSECLPPASRSPVRQKTLLHACKSDGEAISPTEVESPTGGFDVVDGRMRDAPQTAPVLMQKTDGMKLIVRMNRKIRSCLRFASKSPNRQFGDARVPVVDLSSEDVPVTPSILALTYSELLQLGRSSR